MIAVFGKGDFLLVTRKLLLGTDSLSKNPSPELVNNNNVR